MDSVQYIQEDILNGFTEEVLKELAKKLKRKIGLNKSDLINEILLPPRGKWEEKAKIWQEINRLLRKDLETISNETGKILLLQDVPLNEKFKYGYMLTLSTSPEIRAQGEQIYLQAQENKMLNSRKEFEDQAKNAIAAVSEIEPQITALMDPGDDKEIIVAQNIGGDLGDKQENIMIETEKEKEIIGDKEENELLGVNKEIEMINEKIEMINANEENEVTGKAVKTAASEKKPPEDIKELRKTIRILENKLTMANKEGQKIKEQNEKLKFDLTTIKSLLIREKEDAKKYRKIAEELQTENKQKDQEIQLLNIKYGQKSEQDLAAPEKVKYPAQPKVPPQNLNRSLGRVDLSIYQGRKALIFAKRDNEVDDKLNALGIIPIWAMEIDWNRPRRRMSTCEIILYKMDHEKLEKLDEIRDLARNWNIPCNELVNI